MITSRYRSLNNIHNTEVSLDAKCAGKDCKRKGVSVLEIKLLHKKGIFCKQCSEELYQLDLVEDIVDIMDTEYKLKSQI